MNKNSFSQRILPLFPDDENYSRYNFSPLPMQYLGSKLRISLWIINSIRTYFPHSSIFLDLFGGTGSISCAALGHNYRVLANDIQPYSYMVLRSLLVEKRDGLEELANKIIYLNKNESLLTSGRQYAADLLEKEDELFYKWNHRKLNWEDYRNFCERTPIITGESKEIEELRECNAWNLFIKYYGNTYFGIRQCLALDAIREFSHNLNPGLKIHVIAATVSIMTYAVSSTTHLAQFLKPGSEKRVSNIIKKRKFDIIEELSNRLKTLNSFPLPQKKSTVMNLDYKDVLKNLNLNNKWIVYVDPPYFKEHYSRYYHVLDTYCLYDYPFLTFNPRIGKITTGKYRKDRRTSDFGLKSSVENAFKYIISLCYDYGANLAISYANTSLLDKTKILEMADNIGYKSLVEEKILAHSGQGQSRGKHVTEYLFLFSS